MGNTLPVMQGTLFHPWIRKIPWRREQVATHSSVLAWRFPWTEESGGLQTTESQRVRHDRATNTVQGFQELNCLFPALFSRHFPMTEVPQPLMTAPSWLCLHWLFPIGTPFFTPPSPSLRLLFEYLLWQHSFPSNNTRTVVQRGSFGGSLSGCKPQAPPFPAVTLAVTLSFLRWWG